MHERITRSNCLLFHKDNNPVDFVYFFKRGEAVIAERIKTDEKLRSTLPHSFINRSIRVFSKVSGQQRKVAAAFAEWARDQDGAGSPHCSMSQDAMY